MKSHFHKNNIEETLAKLKDELAKEMQLRKAAEENLRTMDTKHKRLEIELNRYREHFESLVASRTAELIAINEKLVKENRERRLAERERRGFEDQFREASLLIEAMLNAIPDIIGVQDTQRRILRFNKAGYRFFGKNEADIIGKPCYEMIGEKEPCDNCVSSHILKTGRPARLEKYIENKEVWMDIRAYPILDMDGRVIRIVEHWRDITELKKSQASLVESEEKYRLLVENAQEAIFVFQNDTFRFYNRRGKEMAAKLGLLAERKPLIDYVHPNDLTNSGENLRKRLNGEEEEPKTLVLRLINNQNDLMWVELISVNLKWKGKPATLNFARDITRDKMLEGRFQEAQRMESIGTLAGGIAHDFNNLLMGIQGNVSLMYLDVEKDPSLSEKLKSIEECVDSGSRLTKQLLGFARGGKYVVKPIDLNQLMKSSADMFGRTRKSIIIHNTYDEDLWTVVADGNQIEQVLVNLYLNAWKAMGGAGEMSLTTENVNLKKSFVMPYDVKPGRYVKITVSDTGIGMPEEIQQRIFEPFFTTQEPGRGTGLGLASAFGIIKNHSGIITVESAPGKGSTFNVYLPASDKVPETETKPDDDIKIGSETILLVDDEAYIIDVGELMLQGLGYTVLTANNGKDALKICSELMDSIDLVVLDMVMPEMGGDQVFHAIRELKPDIKVLFASGHYVSDQTHELLKSGASDFLQKPFNLRQLSMKVRALLDED